LEITHANGRTSTEKDESHETTSKRKLTKSGSVSEQMQELATSKAKATVADDDQEEMAEDSD